MFFGLRIKLKNWKNPKEQEMIYRKTINLLVPLALFILTYGLSLLAVCVVMTIVSAGEVVK
jgi:hypothetical protein